MFFHWNYNFYRKSRSSVEAWTISQNELSYSGPRLKPWYPKLLCSPQLCSDLLKSLFILFCTSPVLPSPEELCIKYPKSQDKNTKLQKTTYPFSINPRRAVRAIVYETSVKGRKKGLWEIFLCLGLKDIIMKFKYLLSCKNKTSSCNWCGLIAVICSSETGDRACK